MNGKRSAKISGEIVMEDDCKLEDLVKDMFACFEKYNATPLFRIYEIIENEEQIMMQKTIRDIINKRTGKTNVSFE